MDEIAEIRLHIAGQIFTAKKDLLCEQSDYFRAMFSGNYVENNQRDITIDVDAVDANSMNIILRYMELGLIDLSELELQVIGSLALAANFLQITELIKQIEYCLDLQLSPSNWIDTMKIAENAAYPKLQQTAAAYGLLSFKTMTIECIPTIKKLLWYLSHPYLDTSSELDVYKFGLEWVLCKETGADALLIIIGCLDIKRLTGKDLEEINLDLKTRGFEKSLAGKVVESLLKVCEDQDKSKPIVITHENLQTACNERVYVEVLNILRASKERRLVYTAVIPVWMMKDSKLDFAPHFMYTFSLEKGFEKWLEVADKNLWGWSVVSWGASKLVVVGGEHGRGTGCFMRDVKVYDTLRQEWICHGVQLPQRRHGGVTIVGDNLFLIGGVGGFRVTLDTAITYDLKQRSFRKIARLPDAIQCPAICTHKGQVYAAGHKDIFRYEEENDRWITVIKSEMRTNRMSSFKNHIYCAQNYFSSMYRFEPSVDNKLELITNYSQPPAAVCKFNDCLLVFTRPMCGQSECIAVEEYREETGRKAKVLLKTSQSQFTVNDVAGSCTLVIDIPSLQNDISSYHQKYIGSYAHV